MSARVERTKRERFLPYAYARFGLTCRIESVALDGHVIESGLDHERHLVELEEPEWRQLALDGVIELTPAAVQEAFPVEERAQPPGRLIVVVRCPPTRLRRAQTVAEGPLAAAAYPFRLKLPHDELHGALELIPFLVRSSARAPAPGYATTGGARVASGRSWEVRVTPLREPSGKFLDVRYQRFSDDAVLRPIAATLYSLEHEQESPTLWINSDHEQIVAVLSDRGTRGPRARLRELVFDYIAQSVWTQLFLRAALHLEELGEVPYGWEDSTLRELLPGVYPDRRTHPARVEALRVQVQRGELSAVLSRLDTVLQCRSEAVEHIAKLIGETVERRG